MSIHPLSWQQLKGNKDIFTEQPQALAQETKRSDFRSEIDVAY